MHRPDWMVWPTEAQQREVRRAEARLANGLQRLDEAKHYHLSTLAREQRMLQRHLLAIKTGNQWRGMHAVGSQPSNQNLSHPPVSYKKTLLPIIPPAGREPDRYRSAKQHSSCALQARVQDFISSGAEDRTGSSKWTLCLPGLKPQPTNTVPLDTPGESGAKERDRQQDRVRETQRPLWDAARDRHKDGQRENEPAVARLRGKTEETERPAISSPLCPPLEFLAPDAHWRTVHTLPDFAQAMTEARKARYIRHHGQPLSERELSIKEIFSKISRDINTTH